VTPHGTYQVQGLWRSALEDVPCARRQAQERKASQGAAEEGEALMPRQSSSRLSTMAASYMAKGRERVKHLMLTQTDKMVDDFMSICGSVTSQDETKGQFPCKRCGGKNHHYANCPDASDTDEVYAVSATIIDGKPV
jgi:hypothetical protein